MTSAPPADKTFVKGKSLYSQRTPFHHIDISQRKNLRLLHTDHHTIQSAINLDHPERMPLPYMHAMMAALLFQPPPASCLLLGVGGGDLIRYLHHHLPNCNITAVEQDARMVQISHQYFLRPLADNIAIHVNDATEFIKKYQNANDWLLIDLYGNSLPPPLNTTTFYDNCHAALSNSGMLVMNLLTNNADEFKSIVWKIRRRFKQQTLCLNIPQHGNIIILAFKQRPDTLEHASLSRHAAALTSTFELDFNALVENLFTTNPLADGELCF